MSNSTKAIEVFWGEFEKLADKLFLLNSVDDPVYDALLARLHKIDPNLFIEFSADPVARKLIITADGDQELFSTVDLIVAQAPQSTSCNIIALKPKLGFPSSASWEGLTIDIATISFDPLSPRGSSDLGIRIYVPDLAAENVDRAYDAILRALDHGLGERFFAENVQHIEVVAFPDHVPADEFIPLTDLEKYIHWHYQNQPKAE